MHHLKTVPNLKYASVPGSDEGSVLAVKVSPIDYMVFMDCVLPEDLKKLQATHHGREIYVRKEGVWHEA